MKKTNTFNSYVRKYLGGDLPHELAREVDFSSIGSEARHFILRMLGLMRKAGQTVTDFSPWMIWELSDVIPRILPGSLGGIIPPITNPGRHGIFDVYVGESLSLPQDGHGVFVDVGCGFPPLTTLDTARRFPKWKVFGIDRNFAPYLLVDPDGHYACFGEDHTLRYMQPRAGAPALTFFNDQAVARKRFSAAFDRLRPMLATTSETGSCSFESDGYTLIRNAIKEYERGQLTFIEAELGQCSLPPANVVRCMNLLLYFDRKERRHLITQAESLLTEGGIFLAGTNHAWGLFRRYMVCRKQNGCLIPEALAFSPDVLRPLSVVPWFTIHEKEPEVTLLAELVGKIRSNKAFWKEFSLRVDTLLEAHDICRRDKSGFLISSKGKNSLTVQKEALSALWREISAEGYVTVAADALCAAGYDAFVNKVGDIAIRPGARFRHCLL